MYQFLLVVLLCISKYFVISLSTSVCFYMHFGGALVGLLVLLSSWETFSFWQKIVIFVFTLERNFSNQQGRLAKGGIVPLLSITTLAKGPHKHHYPITLALPQHLSCKNIYYFQSDCGPRFAWLFRQQFQRNVPGKIHIFVSWNNLIQHQLIWSPYFSACLSNEKICSAVWEITLPHLFPPISSQKIKTVFLAQIIFD